MTNAWTALFATGQIGRTAFREQQRCIRDVYDRLAPYLETPAGTPPEFAVHSTPPPEAWLSWRKNLFSTLFQSVYQLMEIPEPRRLLYGKIIHLFRIWVTSADNLLDDEDKEVVPIAMPGSARVMRQVVAVMAADRVLSECLNDAVDEGLLTVTQRDAIARESLCRLLPSAAQEASEEGGITVRPSPEEVLHVIHRLKTGLLFQVAFVGPDLVETAAPARSARLREGLMDFGLGCQVLDDIRDLARDLMEKRHNIVLSTLAHHHPALLADLQTHTHDPSERLYLNIPRVVLPLARQGMNLMSSGLGTLGAAGLDYDSSQAESMARAMFPVLDLEGLNVV